MYNGRVALKHPEWVTSRMVTKLLQSPGAPDPVAIHGVLRQRSALGDTLGHTCLSEQTKSNK
jgi:hypothetical protein